MSDVLMSALPGTEEPVAPRGYPLPTFAKIPGDLLVDHLFVLRLVPSEG